MNYVFFKFFLNFFFFKMASRRMFLNVGQPNVCLCVLVYCTMGEHLTNWDSKDQLSPDTGSCNSGSTVCIQVLLSLFKCLSRCRLC